MFAGSGTPLTTTAVENQFLVLRRFFEAICVAELVRRKMECSWERREGKRYGGWNGTSGNLIWLSHVDHVAVSGWLTRERLELVVCDGGCDPLGES